MAIKKRTKKNEPVPPSVREQYYQAYKGRKNMGNGAVREASFQTQEQVRRKTVDSTKPNSFSAKNKVGIVQNISDYPVTFTGSAKDSVISALNRRNYRKKRK